MTPPLRVDPIRLGQAMRSACLRELRALKPGNVHVHAPSHGMTVADFETSAEAVADVFTLPHLAVGERIYKAVEETRESVGTNTNLGIILLSVPLAHGALLDQAGDLRPRLSSVLAGLDMADAELAFRAIRLANPAGLGQSEHHDVHAPARVSLHEAMAEAAERDLIARQYSTDFDDVFAFGLPLYREALARWGDEDWVTTRLYLGYLSRFPDSHIARKFGLEQAEKVRLRAEPYEQQLREAQDPALSKDALLAFDEALKTEGLNPGTSADMTVATLLAYELEALLTKDDGLTEPAP